MKTSQLCTVQSKTPQINECSKTWRLIYNRKKTCLLPISMNLLCVLALKCLSELSAMLESAEKCYADESRESYGKELLRFVFVWENIRESTRLWRKIIINSSLMMENWGGFTYPRNDFWYSRFRTDILTFLEFLW